ncbi:MAG: hypothetical protein SNG69_02215 [Rikenellaceae bacterium]
MKTKTPEVVLSLTATITLVIGFITFIASFSVVEDGAYSILILLSFIISWAVMRVLSNISNSLKEINLKLNQPDKE